MLSGEVSLESAIAEEGSDDDDKGHADNVDNEKDDECEDSSENEDKELEEQSFGGKKNLKITLKKANIWVN